MLLGRTNLWTFIRNRQKVAFYFVPPVPKDEKIFESVLSCNLSGETFMSIKHRIAVQATEFYSHKVSPYNFTIAIVGRTGGIKMNYMLDDAHATPSDLESAVASNNYIFCYETPNYVLQQSIINSIPQQEENNESDENN